MNRVEAIQAIIEKHGEAFFILSNGLTSREAVHFLRNDRSFYMLHGMGESLSVGMGLASARPNLKVVVIEGDGNALMGMASWSLEIPANLRHYIISNGEFETTGGQKIPAFPCLPERTEIVEFTSENLGAPNPPAPTEIYKNARNWLSSSKE